MIHIIWKCKRVLDSQWMITPLQRTEMHQSNRGLLFFIFGMFSYFALMLILELYDQSLWHNSSQSIIYVSVFLIAGLWVVREVWRRLWGKYFSDSIEPQRDKFLEKNQARFMRWACFDAGIASGFSIHTSCELYYLNGLKDALGFPFWFLMAFVPLLVITYFVDIAFRRLNAMKGKWPNMECVRNHGF